MAKSWGGARHRSRPATTFAVSFASCRSPATTALNLAIVLVDIVRPFSTGQLKWQNGQTGRLYWQRANFIVTGHMRTSRRVHVPRSSVSCLRNRCPARRRVLGRSIFGETQAQGTGRPERPQRRSADGCLSYRYPADRSRDGKWPGPPGTALRVGNLG